MAQQSQHAGLCTHPLPHPHPGHRPTLTRTQDLVIPSYKSPEAYRQSTLLGNPPFTRDILLFLRGDMGFWRAFHYSRGIRQKLVQ